MMRMIKMTRNITRFKITSDLQIKHGLASNKKRYIRTTTPGLGPFHLIYTPPYGREFLRGFEKAVSEGLCASASFDLCVFSEG